MSTFQSEFGNGAKIIIPSIQREYVQPLNESIIKGFIEVLVKAFLSGDHKDLNYLYGVDDEEGYFIPIDGQQRLTTLWLLHLYVAARLGMKLQVTIEYQTRDICGDFCSALSEKLVTIDFNKHCISEEIKDANWFIGCWIESITVKSILIALDEIHEILNNIRTDFKTLWKNMNAGVESPVQFAFHNPKDLGKDIYVKMNSRGKVLTQFENLKAWLDDKLKSYCEHYDSHSFSRKFYTEWRIDIDNDWTDFFWRNRDISSAFPEEIDDAQLRLFYTIAYVFWAQKDIKGREALNLNPDSNVKFDSEGVLSRMRNSSVDIPIYELNRLNIFNEEILLFTRRVLNGLIKIEPNLNNGIQAETDKENESKIFFWELPGKKLTFISQLLLSEKDEKIPFSKMVLAASVLFFAVQNIDSKILLNWMRFARNIVNNTRIDSDNIHNVLSAFKKWAKELKLKGWDEFIEELGYATAIDRKQIDEEKAKAKWIKEYAQCAQSLYKLENHRFFFGRISFLINYMHVLKANKVDDSFAKLFVSYSELLSSLFDDDGPNRSLKLRDKHRFHRAILALSEYHGYGVWSGANWFLSNNKESWKEYIEDFNLDDNHIPHNIGIIRLINKLKDFNGDYQIAIDTLINDTKINVSDWRKELIDYPDLWSYMDAKNIRFLGNYQVFLLKGKSLGKRNRRAELRTRGLYSYLKISVFKASESENENSTKGYVDLNGWSLNFYDWYCSERKNSCLYFQKAIEDKVIAADVYYDTTLKFEDAYCIEIFDRKGQKEMNREISEISLAPFEKLLQQNNFVWDENGFIEKRNLSREAIVEFLKIFISYNQHNGVTS